MKRQKVEISKTFNLQVHSVFHSAVERIWDAVRTNLYYEGTQPIMRSISRDNSLKCTIKQCKGWAFN